MILLSVGSKAQNQNQESESKEKLNILWTTDNKDTAINMIAMYSNYSVRKDLWEEINVIIWGASTKLVAKDIDVQKVVGKMLSQGINVKACLACSNQFGVTDALKDLGIEVSYMGKPLTDALKNDEKILTF